MIVNVVRSLPMLRLDRRAFLYLAALLAPAARLRALVQAPPLSTDEFQRLSERLLARTGLDARIAATYRDALLETPANAKLLAQLAKAVEAGVERSAEARALEATIVEWWYTGTYMRNGEPRLATHTGALMWGALGMPAPGSCTSAFGAWSIPPAAGKKA
jgi:hypothetical protein